MERTLLVIHAVLVNRALIVMDVIHVKNVVHVKIVNLAFHLVVAINVCYV
tara:strand:- start:153 stop:302 length:150 start_codon:yes stop_codon:yes gene_type:complete